MQIPMKIHWDYNSTNILIAVGKPGRETNEDCVVYRKRKNNGIKGIMTAILRPESFTT